MMNVGDFVFIKSLGIYGKVKNFWKAFDEKGKEKNNYIITDLIGVEHERWEEEIELVDDINTSIEKAKCNLPLETIIEKFKEINPNYSIFIEIHNTSTKVTYGSLVYSYKECRYIEKPCIIRNENAIGDRLVLPDDENYLHGYNEYKCSINGNNDVKSTVFELYMNIITRLEKKDE